jgi:hypothetical protein
MLVICPNDFLSLPRPQGEQRKSILIVQKYQIIQSKKIKDKSKK